jgi:hypothetical protein
MNNHKKSLIINKILDILLSSFKSFWSATVNICYGIAIFVILSAGLFYLRVNNVTNVIYINEFLSKIILFLINNWELFWAVFFIIRFIQQMKELSYK